MSFHLPPLRERVQDIAPLVRGMAARFNTKFRKELFDISPQAMDALETFPWPGNIRQLENFIQQAVLVSSGPELLFEHLPQQVRDYRPSAGKSVPAALPRLAGRTTASNWNATSSSARWPATATAAPAPPAPWGSAASRCTRR